MRQPLIILCPGRSFSSVICAVIGQHPEAFGLPEVHLFTLPKVGNMLDADVPIFGVPGSTTGLRRAVAELAFGEQTEETIGEADKYLAARRDWTGAQMFRDLCELAGDRVVVDKSPTNTRPNATHRVLDAFPEGKFLHIARHPRATMRSQAKAFANSKHMFKSEGAVFHWLKHHRAALEVADVVGPDQYMYLKGEWFLEDPAPVLKQICEWLGLSTDKEAIEQMMKPEESPFAVLGPGNARYGNNAGFIENPHLRIGKIKDESLTDPLEWLEPKEIYIDHETRALAHMLGY